MPQKAEDQISVSTPALSVSAQKRIWKYKPSSSFLKMVQKFSHLSVSVVTSRRYGTIGMSPKPNKTEHAKMGKVLKVRLLSC